MPLPDRFLHWLQLPEEELSDYVPQEPVAPAVPDDRIMPHDFAEQRWLQEDDS